MIKEFMKFMAVVGMMFFIVIGGHVAYGQGATMGECKTIENFYDAAHQNGFKNEQFTYLTGTALERFAANMDRISGGGHGPMTGLIFLTPSDQPSETDITVIEVFKDGCDLGTAMVPSQMVRKALGEGV